MSKDIEPSVAAGSLEALSAARAMLERASSLDDVVRIRDQAESIRSYLRVQREGLAMQNEAAELKLRAERKAGGLLRSIPREQGTSSQDGTKYAQALRENNIARSTAHRFERINELPQPEFESYIARTKAEHELTTAGALKLAKRLATTKGHDSAAPRASVDNLEVTPELFSAVVIDPPWRYSNVATRGAAEDHYGTMSHAELLELRVPAADDSHLYLWVTNSFIEQGFDLMRHWGFTYKTCLTWCKPQIGMGNYFRSTTEHVLFGLRGRCPTLTNNTPTHFVADRQRHSQKPDCFYDLVEHSSPGPYLEMFARRRRIGWHVWGNEA